MDACNLPVPLPRTLSAIGEHHHRLRQQGGWRFFTPRHAPAPTLEGRLTFALKYEGLDLAILKRLFESTGPKEIEAIVETSLQAHTPVTMELGNYMGTRAVAEPLKLVFWRQYLMRGNAVVP